METDGVWKKNRWMGDGMTGGEGEMEERVVCWGWSSSWSYLWGWGRRGGRMTNVSAAWPTVLLA